MEFKFKTLLYLLIILLSVQLSASAGMLKVEKISNPITIANRVSQPISLSFVTEGNWKLLV